MNLAVKNKSTILFFLILGICVGLSMWLSHYIPDDSFDRVISPILIACSTSISLAGAWVIFRHSDGLRIRKVWAFTLLIWGLADGFYLLGYLLAPMRVMNMGAYQLSIHELFIGNLLGWLLLLYPTEALRPRWLTFKRALWQLLPMFALVVLDYAIPVDLALVITFYPIVLLGMLITHLRAYSVWCEENFSTLDDIDIEWIKRYLIIIFMVGIVFLYMCLSHGHTRGFTQLWLVVFMFIYGTEKILFRRDPWEIAHQTSAPSLTETTENSYTDGANSVLRTKLEQWMVQEKPYTNPDFRLIDLQKVLPMNRTYLSQFINTEYGCSFYQFVNRYRIEEAKRLKLENPAMKIQEVSVRCGFSSPTVFSRTFTSVTGLAPREWARQIHSA